MFYKRILASLLLITVWSAGLAVVPAKSQFLSKQNISDKGYFDNQSATAVSNTIVISQFQTSGGNDDDEFIEIHNIGSSSYDVSNHSVVYRSASGTTNLSVAGWSTSTIIPAGGYYLLAHNNGLYDGPTAGNLFFGQQLSASGGGLAILNSSNVVVDSVGWGSATNAFIEGTRTSAPTANNSQSRNNNGCTDNDNNLNDFSLTSPSAPRNSASAANICGSNGTVITASGAATPNSVLPGGATKLTVTVSPATSPTASTGITVTGDLASIGGSATQTFFDNATNGDTTANDNIFTFDTTVSAATTTGSKSLPIAVADAQSRTASTSILLTVTSTGGGGPHTPEEHLVMGNPCNATTDVNNPTNYLLSKLQYAVGYHRDRAIPNWVSWHLDSSWLGSTQRQDNFSPDPTLPAGWYRVTDSSYSGSGFTRGHHTPSGDRTSSVADNSATFLMTNMMPQAAANNNGTWNDLEVYSRGLVGSNELYIIAGGSGIGGDGTAGYKTTIDAGRVTVPAKTWKIIVVLPVGDNDAARVDNNTRVIGVIMPNSQTINADWKKYIATVDQIEALTGCDYLTNVNSSVQTVIEAKVDAASNTAPVVTNRTLNPAEDNSVTITFTGTDYNENNVLDFSIVTPPANGTITPASNLAPSATSFVYTPNPNFFGTDSFTYKANDSAADSNTGTVSITVTSVNDAPVAVNDAKSTYKNMTSTFPATDLISNDNAGAANESGQTLTVTSVITTAQTNGTVSLSNGQITYQPTTEYTGTASFDYQVCDNGTTNGAADPKCSVATVNYNVLAPSAGAAQISGRVLSSKGRGVASASVIIVDGSGREREVRTNAFGYYRLTDLAVGESYVVNVRHKLYSFAPRVLNLSDNIADFDFIAQK